MLRGHFKVHLWNREWYYRLFWGRSSTGEHWAKMPKNRVFGFSNRVFELLGRIFGVFLTKIPGFYRVFGNFPDFWGIFTQNSVNFWLKIEFFKILKSSFCQKSSSLTFGQIEFFSNRTKNKPAMVDGISTIPNFTVGCWLRWVAIKPQCYLNW